MQIFLRKCRIRRRFGDMTTQEPASPRERRYDLNVSGFDGQEVTVLNRDDALRFGYNFIFEDTDAALGKF